MARQLSMDIAIEDKIYADRGSQGPPLLVGFTARDTVANPLHLARHLRRTDELAISIYLLRPVPENPGPLHDRIKGLSLKMSFGSGDNKQVIASPVDQITLDEFYIHPAKELNRKSFAFNAVAEHVWNAFPVANAPAYPDVHQLQENDPKEQKTVFHCLNVGSFVYTLLLKLQLDSGASFVYRVDPEMIVETEDVEPTQE